MLKFPNKQCLFAKRSLDQKNNKDYIPLTEDAGLSINDTGNGKNLNVCIIGAAGTGKTLRYVVPSILQSNTSYVCTDRKGEVSEHVKETLSKQGYTVKTIDLGEIDGNGILNVDAMDFGAIGEKKTAVFIEYSIFNDKSMKTTVSIIERIFKDLTEKSELYPDKTLPVHVRFMLDEFGQYDTISDLSEIMAKSNPKNVSVNIVLQNIMQLKGHYADWEDIIAACDSILLFGTCDSETNKYACDLVKNWCANKEKESTLKSFDETRIVYADMDECCLLTRGKEPLFSRKIKLNI